MQNHKKGAILAILCVCLTLAGVGCEKSPSNINRYQIVSSSRGSVFIIDSETCDVWMFPSNDGAYEFGKIPVEDLHPQWMIDMERKSDRKLREISNRIKK